MTIQFTTLVFTALHLGELVSSLIADHDLPQELWERKVPACPCCFPEADLSEAAHQLPFGELVSLIQGLIVSPNGVNHQVLQRAATLGAITISGDLDDICGWDWTPAGLLVAKDIIGDMFSDGLICPDCGTILSTIGGERTFCCWDRAEHLGLVLDEDTNTWSSPEGFRWRHSHGTRLSASGL